MEASISSAVRAPPDGAVAVVHVRAKACNRLFSIFERIAVSMASYAVMALLSVGDGPARPGPANVPAGP